MKNALIVNALLLLMAAEALAASGGHGSGHDGIPWKTVMWQSINILMVVAGLIYFLKKPIREMFSQRRAEYAEAAEKAMQARLAAEAANREIRERVERLENTEQESLVKAKAEAEALHQKIIVEAKEASDRIQRDTQRMVEAELMKAKTNLRNEVIDQAFLAAEKSLRNQVGEAEQKRLQGEFVNKIEIARS